MDGDNADFSFEGGKGRKGSKARKSRSSSSQRDPRTKAELYACAKKKDIEGRSTMTKAQLKRALDK